MCDELVSQPLYGRHAGRLNQPGRDGPDRSSHHGMRIGVRYCQQHNEGRSVKNDALD